MAIYGYGHWLLRIKAKEILLNNIFVHYLSYYHDLLHVCVVLLVSAIIVVAGTIDLSELITPMLQRIAFHAFVL